MSVDEYIELVNELIDGFTNTAKSIEPESPRRARIDSRIEGLESLRDFLDNHARAVVPMSPELGDLSDLPPDLIEELAVSQVDELEKQIKLVIGSFGGMADIDQVLVGLYRRFREKQKRRFIQNKLYRMATKNVIFAVPRKRGTYTLTPPEAEHDSPAEPVLEDDDSEIPF